MFGVIIFAFLVVTLTTLSMSAIASNGQIEGGGAYFMISRALGPEFGGSIGVIFYLANVVGCALYLVGFSEAFMAGFEQWIPTSKWYGILYSSAMLLLVTIVCLVGASAYAKTSLVIFAVLMVSIASAMGSVLFAPKNVGIGFTSWSSETLSHNLYPKLKRLPVGVEPQTIQTVFGIFFPASTGIMAGANLSGDLRTPSSSIPRGTLLALGITLVIYLILTFALAYTVQSEALLNNYFILQNVCFAWWIVTIGIVCSTVSSALGNLIGSSRVLQALAKDKLIPFLNVFGRGYGKTDEPRLGVVLSWAIVQILLILGNLNLLATVTTMFFLTSYCVVNFACFSLKISGTPNWRPTFRYSNQWTSLAGAILCFFTMFYVGWITATVSFVCLVVFFVYIHLQSPRTSWGDLSQAIYFHQVRKYMLRLDVRKDHVKYWRPQILLLVGSARANVSLIDTANNLKKGGMFLIGSVLVGDLYSQGDRFKRDEAAWNAFIKDTRLKAFSELVIAPSISAGAQNLIEMAGLGAMKPNTVIVGFPEYSSYAPGALTALRPRPTPPAPILGTSSSSHFMPARASINNGGDSTDKVDEAGGGLGERTVSQYRVKYVNAVEDNFVDDTSSSRIEPREWVTILNSASFMGKNIMVARNFDALDKDLIASKARASSGMPFRRKKVMTIDVWPVSVTGMEGDFVHTLTLMLLYAHMLNKTDIWTKFTTIRVLTFVASAVDIEPETARVRAILHQARIKASINVVVASIHGQGSARFAALNAMFRQHSAQACMVFTTLPLPPASLPEPSLSPPPGPIENYIADLDTLSSGLPPVILLHGLGSMVLV